MLLRVAIALLVLLASCAAQQQHIVRGLPLVLLSTAGAAAQLLAQTLKGDSHRSLPEGDCALRGCRVCDDAGAQCLQCEASDRPSNTAITYSWKLDNGVCTKLAHVPWYYHPGGLPLPTVQLEAGDGVVFHWTDGNVHSIFSTPYDDACNLMAPASEMLFGGKLGVAGGPGETAPRWRTGPLAAGQYGYACGSVGHCDYNLMYTKVNVMAPQA